MKKILVVLTLVIAIMGSLSAQTADQKPKKDGFWKKVGHAAKTVAPQIAIDSPFLRNNLGVSYQAHNMVVTNATGLHCDLVAYGSRVAELNPGDIAYDDRHWEPLSPQVPVVALCFKDATHAEYVGAGYYSFYLSSGYSTSSQWTISYVQTPTGLVTPRTSATTSAESKKVPFPREWWNSTGGLQIVNNTTHAAAIRINGRDFGQLPPGALFYYSAKLIGGVGRMASATLVFGDGEFNGVATTSFAIPQNGIFVQQFIVGEPNISRQ